MTDTTKAQEQPEENEREARDLALASPEYARVKTKNLEFMDNVRWNTMSKMAQSFLSSDALPSGLKNANRVIMVLQAGYEAGLKPIEAMNSFYFVNGRLALYGEAVIRQVIRAGHKVTWGTCDEKQAEVTITRGDTGESMTSKFTIEQAKQRGFLSKEPWQKYPENMLKFRAFSMAAKFIAPDALMGLNIGEEVEVFTEPVDAAPMHVTATRIEPVASTSVQAARPSLDQALSQEETETAPEEPVEPKKRGRKPKSAPSEEAQGDEPLEEIQVGTEEDQSPKQNPLL